MRQALIVPVLGIRIPEGQPAVVGGVRFSPNRQSSKEGMAGFQESLHAAQREFHGIVGPILRKEFGGDVEFHDGELESAIVQELGQRGCLAVWEGSSKKGELLDAILPVRRAVNGLKLFWLPPRPRSPLTVPSTIDWFSGWGMLGQTEEGKGGTLTVGPLWRGRGLILKLARSILESWNQEGLAAVSDALVRAEGATANWTDMAVVQALDWYGEAWDELSVASATVKLRVALDVLLGFPGDQDVPSDALTARISERSAFLLGADLDTRVRIKKDTARLFHLASAVVHGSGKSVDLADCTLFENLVRAAIIIMSKDHPVKSREEFQSWLERVKYR